jgi:lipoyl(octanoyl) transferase
MMEAEAICRQEPRRGAMLPAAGGSPVDWTVAAAPVPYPDAIAHMEGRVAGMWADSANEQAWLVEHPALYTAGTSARPADLLAPDRFPVYPAGRGGQYTYHGPGQRVAYLMLDLHRRAPDVRLYVSALEQWIIDTLAVFRVRAERRCDAIGIWVERPAKGIGRADKIAAIGIRIRHWITFHGVALNVDPELEHFSGIIPCGIATEGVTSLADLGVNVSMEEVDAALRAEFERLFGKTATAP